MRIKVDVDNVIRDMSKEMLVLYNHWFGTDMTKKDIKDYDVDVSFPMFKTKGMDARDIFFNKLAERIYMDPKPMKGAVNGLNKLKEQGHEIIIVSYQPSQKSKEFTLDWLRKNNIPYDAIVFTNKEDKTIIPADYIIDDNPKFLDMDPGKKVCIDWAYNRGRNYDYRVKSIYEFANSLEK